MVQQRKKCKGFFRGLVVNRKDKNGGPWAAIEQGNCNIINYIKGSNIPEILQLEKDIVTAFIQGELLRKQRI